MLLSGQANDSRAALQHLDGYGKATDLPNQRYPSRLAGAPQDSRYKHMYLLLCGFAA